MHQRVIIIHYTAPSYAGGVETALGDFIRASVKLGRDIHLVVGKGSDLDLPGCAFHRIDLLNAENPAVLKANSQAARGDWNAPDELQLRAELLAVIRPGDEIHAHNVVCNSFNLLLSHVLRWIVTNMDLKLVAWCWDPVWIGDGGDGLSPKEFALLCTPWPKTLYLTLSRARTEAFDRIGTFPEDCVREYWPFVSVDRVLSLSKTAAELCDQYNMLDADIIVTYPCRLSRRKNIEFSLHVIREIRDQGLEPLLLLGGFASPHREAASLLYKQELVDLERKLCITRNVVWLDRYRGDHANSTGLATTDVMSLHRISDVFLSPSLDEGFGLAVLEAAANGVPVVASAEAALLFTGHSCVSKLLRSDQSPRDVAGLVLKSSEGRRQDRTIVAKYSSKKYFDVLDEIVNTYFRRS
ncbi:MAG: glycosyltransferase [Acidobacteriaceae bacterium]|jgi:glycosyltransferase involved in cell wall biosynthesis